jgi:pimeloyl-ACP methyl ester carboxylesterase
VTAAVHAEQLADLMESEHLHDVVLVGHSCDGSVIRMIPERSPRVTQVVYLDALIPSHGRPPPDAFPPALITDITTHADESGDGWRLDPTEQFLQWDGISNTADIAWMTSRLEPFLTARFHKARHDAGGGHHATAAGIRRQHTGAGAAIMASQAERTRDEGWPVTTFRRALPHGY